MNVLPKPKLVILHGPTASGKSSLAFGLAQKWGGEIISADSLQVYRYLDIGTAKPSGRERELVPHHLIDLVDPDENFHAGAFMTQARSVIGDISRKGRPILVVGGTGLYIKALLHGLCDAPEVNGTLREDLRRQMTDLGPAALHRRLQELDPEAAAKIGVRDRVRIQRALEVVITSGLPLSQAQRDHHFSDTPYDCLKIGLLLDREELYGRIDRRVEAMMAAGFVAEVESLLARGYSPELKPMKSLGYRQLIRYLAGRTDLTRATEDIKKETRNYAKRQMTWLRRDPDIKWFYISDMAEIEREILLWLDFLGGQKTGNALT